MMECENTDEKPGPSGGSDLIIITPDELAKLGLFQNLQVTAEQSKAKNKFTESANESMKAKVKGNKVANIEEAKKIISNRTNDNVAEKSSISLKSEILSKPLNSLTRRLTDWSQKVLNSEVAIVSEDKIVENRIVGDIKCQNVLNSKLLNKSLVQSSTNKSEDPAKKNWAPPPNNAPNFNPSSNQPKILNNELKFKQRKFIIAQKKIDQQKPVVVNSQHTSGNKCAEKSTVRAEISNTNIPAVKKLIDITSVKTISTNDSREPSKYSLPLKKCTSLQETLRRGLSRVLQRDINKASSTLQLSELPIVIEDSNDELDTPSTSTSLEKILKKDTIASTAPEQVKRLEVTENIDETKIISVEHWKGPLEQITSPKRVKKEVNIISNTSVQLSNEVLKLLVSKPKFNAQNNSPKKMSALPVKINTDCDLTETEVSNVITGIYTETGKLYSTQNASEDIGTTVEQEDMNEMTDTLPTYFSVSENNAKTEDSKENDPTTREMHISPISPHHSEKKNVAPLTVNERIVGNHNVSVKIEEADIKVQQEDTNGMTDTLPTHFSVSEKNAIIIEDSKKNYPTKSELHISQISPHHFEKETDASLTVNERIVRNRKAPPKLLALSKSVSAINADSDKNVLQTEQIGNVEQSGSKLKEETFFKSPHDRNLTDCDDGKYTVRYIPKILRKSSDKNKVRNFLPSTSKMIEGSEHDRQVRNSDTEYENKNISETEVELNNAEKMSKDINKELVEGTNINMKLDNTRLNTKKSSRKNLHMSSDMDIVDVEYEKEDVNKVPYENVNVAIESESSDNEATRIPKRHKNISKKNVNIDNSRSFLKVGGSETVIDGKEKNTQDTKSKNKVIENRGIKNPSPKRYGRKQKINACESTAIAEKGSVLEAIETSETTKVNSSVGNIEIVSKKKGRLRRSRIVIVDEKPRDSVDDSKDDTTKTSGDVKKDLSDASKDCEAHLNEKTSNFENCNTSIDEVSASEMVKDNIISKKSSLITLENPQVGTSKADIDTSIKQPRKRGRPKKVVKEIQEENEHLLSIEKSPEEIISTPLPKKRGRKRKCEIIESTTEEFSEPVILDKSRSGRKRKKVNYFHMENNVTDEEDVVQTKKRRKTAIQIKDSVVKLSKSNCSEDNTSMSTGEKKEDFSKTISEVNQPEENVKQKNECEPRENIKVRGKNDAQKETKQKNMGETVNASTLNSNDCESGENLKDKDDNDTKSDGDDSSKEEKQTKSSNKNTIRLINSIFTAAVINKSRNVSAIEEKETDSPNIIVSMCDRRRKEALSSKIVADEDNMVTCMNCKKKMSNDEWDDHNREIHYCLAWREGDQELNLDDPAFVTKRLRPIMKQKREFKCDRCGKWHNTLNSFMTHIEKCSGVVSSDNLVTCAVCKLEMEKNKWLLHKQKKHNNLAWRRGDHPLNLNDRNLVLNILNALYKAKKPLTCEKCCTTKKSVLGFLSHQAQCGLNIEEAKIKCELCDKKVLPVSMPTHIRMVHETPKINTTELTSDYFNVDCNASMNKRQAAKRAMLVMDQFSKAKSVQENEKHYLQNVDFKEENFVILLLKNELLGNNRIKCKFNSCSFEAEKVTTLVDHMESCENKPDQYYTCKKCLLICNTEEEIKEHIKEAYGIDIIDDDFNSDDDDEEEDEDSEEEEESCHRERKKKKASDKVKPERLGLNRRKHAHLYDIRDKRPGLLFPKAFKFTMEFCEECLSEPVLFDNLRYWDSDWSTVHEDLVEKYLPNYLESCDVAWTKDNTFDKVIGNDYTFKKFEIFETHIEDGTATMFCGGPINAMAWMPTPYTSSDSMQILAVAPANCFEKEYLCTKRYNENSLIQFWSFGVLKNNQQMAEPTLNFSLAVDFGPIWHLEWCPSGCYDSTKDNGPENPLARMGLLAAAGSDGVVYIYSIPFLYQKDLGTILEVKPLLKLFLVPRNSKGIHHEEFYATKISWSKGGGHKYVAVGYTDGMVALYDISTTSELLMAKDHDDVDIIKPIKIFPAHYHSISALHLLHNGDGKSWLLTGSFDRDIFFWDLSNGSKDSAATIGKKFIVTDGVWLTNWLSYVITFDASTTSCPVSATLRSYRDHMCDRVNLTYSNTTINSISASDWLNGIIQGNTAGEIVAMFPHSLFSIESEKNLRSYRYYFGCVKLINKHKSSMERVAEEEQMHKALGNIPHTGDSPESSSNKLYNLCDPMTYNTGAAKYGVVFCDKKMDKISDFLTSDNQPKYDTESELYKPQIYPMRAVNKVAFNPNLQASLYYATGYQCGFVRMRYMKFWEKDPHLNK